MARITDQIREERPVVQIQERRALEFYFPTAHLRSVRENSSSNIGIASHSNGWTRRTIREIPWGAHCLYF